MNGARRNARGETSLQLILDATITLVGRHGYDNTTIARITKATQRPASSIYWYFSTKDELIAAALESSYQPSRAVLPWRAFDPEQPLLEQLLAELEPELEVSESEKPLRLGIMLALEGSAAQSSIQEPFRRRRAGARDRLVAWWHAAFASTPAAGADSERLRSTDERARWMAALTLAFLDGHYLSDVVANHEAAKQRSQAVARGLVGVFTALTTMSPVDSSLTEGDEPRARALDAPPTESHSAGIEDLLQVTRRLVAEHGYDGATMQRICSTLGVRRSSIYWRYKDKDALIAAAVAVPYLELLAPLSELPGPSERWLDELAAAMEATLAAAQRDLDTTKAGLLLKAQRWDPPTSAGSAVLRGSEEVEEQLAAWFTRVPDLANESQSVAPHLAWVVGRLVEGFLLGGVLGRTLTPAEAARTITYMFGSLSR